MTEHLCHAIGCKVVVPPRMLMCKRHWRIVPRDVQRAVWDLYVPGQERRKDPTPGYILVQAIAVTMVAAYEKVFDQAQCFAHLKTRIDAIGGIEAVNNLPEEQRTALRPLLPKL